MTNTSTILSRVLKATGMDTTEALHAASQGTGAASEDARNALQKARATIAASLPLALGDAFSMRLDAVNQRDMGDWLGVSKDTAAKYSIGGALVGQGISPEDAREQVEQATAAKISKRDQWAAAIDSRKAWTDLMATIPAPVVEDDEPMVIDGPEPEVIDGPEPEPTDGTTPKDAETPADRGTAMVQGIAGSVAGLLAALESGEATLSPAALESLGVVVANLIQGTGIGKVTRKAPAA